MAWCRSKSMLMGKGRTSVDFPPRMTSDVSRSIRASIVRSTVSRKFWQWYLQVKAEKIVAQQAFEELFLPRKNAKGLCVWPGNVPELRDDQVRSLRSFRYFGKSPK